jgi:hypothetical protein
MLCAFSESHSPRRVELEGQLTALLGDLLICQRVKNTFSPSIPGERSLLGDRAAMGFAVTICCIKADDAWHSDLRGCIPNSAHCHSRVSPLNPTDCGLRNQEVFST